MVFKFFKPRQSIFINLLSIPEVKDRGLVLHFRVKVAILLEKLGKVDHELRAEASD